MICSSDNCTYRVKVVAKVTEATDGTLSVKWHVWSRNPYEICLDHSWQNPRTINSTAGSVNKLQQRCAERNSIEVQHELGTVDGKSRLQRIVIDLKAMFIGIADIQC